MASEMVEKVAQALAAVIAKRHGHSAEDWMSKARYEEAKAAILAMREPTERMEILAGRDHCSDDHYDPHQTWQKMIDAALSDA